MELRENEKEEEEIVGGVCRGERKPKKVLGDVGEKKMVSCFDVERKRKGGRRNSRMSLQS